MLCAQGHYASAIERAGQAVEEARTAGNRDALARAYNVLDLAGVFGDRFTGGENWLRALEISEELGDLQLQVIILSNLGLGDFHVGRWSEAIARFERAAEVSHSIGDLVGEHLARTNVAELLSNRGMFEEADVRLRESLRVLTAVGYREFRALCLSDLGRNLARMGRYEDAIEILGEARSEYGEIRSQEGVLDCDAKLAECHALRGAATSALDLATDALDRAATAEGGAVEPMLERVRGYALAQLGRRDEAREAFEASLTRARGRGGGMQFDVALALDALVRLAVATGEQVPAGFEAERAELLELLGVVRVADVPLDRDAALTR